MPRALLSQEIAKLPTASIPDALKRWVNDGKILHLSPDSLEARQNAVTRLLRFLEANGNEECGAVELKSFLASLDIRSSSVATYYGRLRTFFSFLVEEGDLASSPMESVKRPIVREDQIQPFTPEECQRLLRAAKESQNPRRDVAICYLLLDTGMRASELCGLRMNQIDLPERKLWVVGKGNKRRSLYYGRTSARALQSYLSREDRSSDDPVFTSGGGNTPGEALTYNGLRLLFRRLGRVAQISAKRCSPHTARHTFAVTFLRNGGNLLALRLLMGHTQASIRCTQRYVLLAEGDVQAQHRSYSPVEQLRANA